MGGRMFATGEFDGDLAALSAPEAAAPPVSAGCDVAFSGGASGGGVELRATPLANLGWVDAFTSAPCRFTGGS